MPSISFLAAPGSPIRLCRHATRLNWPASSTVRTRQLCLLGHPRYCTYREHVRRPSTCFKEHVQFGDSQICTTQQRWYSDIRTPVSHLREDTSATSDTADLNATPEVADVPDTIPQLSRDGTEDQFRTRDGSRKKKRRRLSRPALVLNSIHSSAYDMYLNPIPAKIDLSYKSPRWHQKARLRRRKLIPPSTEVMSSSRPQAMSLYTILARYMYHHTNSHDEGSDFTFTLQERILLDQKGFSPANVEVWATSLVDRNSRTAVAFLEHDEEAPPVFLISLLLRRQHIGRSALGTIMRHIERRTSMEPLGWSNLKILSIRLLRHARKVWPQSTTWIASLFATQASLLFDDDRLSRASPRLLSDVTNFSNLILLLLSLPATVNPILAALDQEKAQFHILEFMASRTPAITVTRTGFRSISRTQLAHPKATQEKEWAEIKGASWPPWKENRTAMDEDKGYEFGASRASKITHRMYEAGYRGHIWEELVEVYAGWDTDFSPTIQTRTSLPHLSTKYRNKKDLTALLWAGRVRATRTRRESWACFLAYEMSGAAVSQQVYLAMFEKLYHTTLKRSRRKELQADVDEVFGADGLFQEAEDVLLPGDVKEVVPDPTSPLHYVYLSEPVPTIKELYHRMHTQNVRPSGRLLAFLIEASPSFATCIDLLRTSKGGFNGGIGQLVSGVCGDNDRISEVPQYLLAAFIKCLCRFGRFTRPPGYATLYPSDRHAYMLLDDRHYLLEYAYILLSRYLPQDQPAWIAYMDNVAHSSMGSTDYNESELTPQSRGIVQYNIVWKLVDLMEENDIDIGDQVFRIVCTTTMYAAQAAIKNGNPNDEVRHALAAGPIRLRQLFHRIVGAHIPPQSTNASSSQTDLNRMPPHIPSPAELHAFVRALGMLRDYEGLYSFSRWLTDHHAEVDARSKAQHSGTKLLFKTLVALRAAMTGQLENLGDQEHRAPDELLQLVREQIESVKEWGGWPSQEYVDLYVRGGLKGGMPRVGGR